MVEVTVRNGEQLERALRRFKKKWERAGVLREVKRKSFFISISFFIFMYSFYFNWSYWVNKEKLNKGNPNKYSNKNGIPSYSKLIPNNFTYSISIKFNAYIHEIE